MRMYRQKAFLILLSLGPLSLYMFSRPENCDTERGIRSLEPKPAPIAKLLQMDGSFASTKEQLKMTFQPSTKSGREEAMPSRTTNYVYESIPTSSMTTALSKPSYRSLEMATEATLLSAVPTKANSELLHSSSPHWRTTNGNLILSARSMPNKGTSALPNEPLKLASLLAKNSDVSSLTTTSSEPTSATETKAPSTTTPRPTRGFPGLPTTGAAPASPFSSPSTTTARCSKPKVILLVVIFSAFSALDRRNAIRTTWLKKCEHYSSMKCVFIQDRFDFKGNPVPHLNQIIEESNKFQNDTIIIDSLVGYNFGYRVFETLKWALEAYDFDYFLRIDDDQYLCVDRIMYELQRRSPENLYWGFQHCRAAGDSPIDEGFVVLSSDLCRAFYRNVSTMLCHPFGSESISMWVLQLEKTRNTTQRVARFGDNIRIHHNPNSLEKAQLMKESNLCGRYISLHNTLPSEMLTYHEIVRTENNTAYDIPPITNKCPHAYTELTAQALPCLRRPVVAQFYVNRNGVKLRK